MNHLLGNNNIVIRFISLYALGLILFFISWIIAYYFLPESLLKNVGLLVIMAGDTAASSLNREFIQILLLNMLAFLFILGSNLILRVKKFHLDTWFR